MARIRTIKPEFFTSEDIVELSPLARLFYVSLWCEADRAGRLRWKPKTLKYRYLPADDVSIEDLCAELSEAGLIVIYEVGGKDYCEIPTFSDHQVVNNRERESEIPARDDSDSTRGHASKSRESGVKAEGKGREGKGRESPIGDYAPPPPEAPPDVFLEIPLNRKDETFPVTNAKVAEYQETYPAVNVEQELRNARQWSIDNPTRRKTKSGIPKFLNSWLARAQNQAPPAQGGFHENRRPAPKKSVIDRIGEQARQGMANAEAREAAERPLAAHDPTFRPPVVIPGGGNYQ